MTDNPKVTAMERQAWFLASIVTDSSDPHYDSFIKAMAEALESARAEALQEAEKACWRVADEKIGVHDQVDAFKIGHGQGAYECAKLIGKIAPARKAP